MDYRRDILAMDDAQLEEFVHRWVKVMTGRKYVDVQLFRNAGDMGRDVAGFLTPQRHEGPWHNYQCKQLTRTLQVGPALLELGKVIYYSYRGEFTLPSRFTFVAPRGVARTLERLLFNPSQLRQEIISRWGDHCRGKIVKNTIIKLEGDLLEHLHSFDFSCVDRMKLEDILADDAVGPVLTVFFGADPGSPPPHTVPPNVESTELRYVSELVHAYAERDGCSYACHTEVVANAKHGSHFKEQRERFYVADRFNRYYRDSTLTKEMDDLQAEIYHGTIETHRAPHPDSLARVNAVMSDAAKIPPTGPLRHQAGIRVRQGFWHHFVNDGTLSWKR